LSFAYGSGVFHQDGHDEPENNVTDLIFIVEDSERWHEENMRLNSRDYSSKKTVDILLIM